MGMLKMATSKADRGGIVGSLRDDLAEIARKVHDATSRFDVTVWADADEQVFFECADRTPEIPAGDVAGTYGAGAIPDDIESDLHVLRNARLPVLMLCN